MLGKRFKSVLAVQVFISLSCSAMPFDEQNKKYFNFSPVNPAPKVQSGVTYPRLGQPLFRGVPSDRFHYQPEEALKGLLGMNAFALESRLFSSMKNSKSYDPYTMDAAKAVLFNRYAGANSMKEVSARVAEVNSGQFQNLPDEAVFGSLFYDTALSYVSYFGGGHGMVYAFHDYERRGVDLNFAMNQMGENDSNWDAGEYILPVLVDQDEIDGFMLPEFREAYFKVTEAGHPYVLVYQDVDCLFKQNDLIFDCSKNRPKPAKFSTLLVSNQQANAGGVWGFAKDGTTAKVPPGFFKKHNVFIKDSIKTTISLKKLKNGEGTAVPITIEAIEELKPVEEEFLRF